MKPDAFLREIWLHRLSSTGNQTKQNNKYEKFSSSGCVICVILIQIILLTFELLINSNVSDRTAVRKTFNKAIKLDFNILTVISCKFQPVFIILHFCSILRLRTCVYSGTMNASVNGSSTAHQRYYEP